MKLINLTRHEIKIIDDDKSLVIPPSGIIARYSEIFVLKEVREVENEDGDKLKVKIGQYEPNLNKMFSSIPPSEPGTFYLVSSVIGHHVDRNDLLVPDTGPDSGIRNAKGHIKGIKRLIRPRYRGIKPPKHT